MEQLKEKKIPGLFKKNNNWFMDFWYRGKRYRRKISPDKRQAELALKKVKVSIAENKFFDVKKQQRILFKEMTKEYIERYSRLNKRSTGRDDTSLKHLIPYFKNKYIFEVSPQSIEDYKAKRLNDGMAKSTVNRELALLKHIYTKAIEWGKITENPVKKVKLFKEDNQRVRYLEKGEITMLLNTCKGYLQPIVITALYTGMRLSELLNLIWDDIDFNRGIITVKITKNNEKRYLPMNTELRNVLEYLKKNCNLDSPYVFCNNKGDRFAKFTISHRFNKVIKELGIKNFRFHDLRHTFASHLIMSGADIVTIQRLLGHKTLAMTLRYSHLSPNFMQSTVECLRFDIDTFWTLGQNEESIAKEQAVENNCNINAISRNVSLAQLVEQRTLNP